MAPLERLHEGKYVPGDDVTFDRAPMLPVEDVDHGLHVAVAVEVVPDPGASSVE